MEKVKVFILNDHAFSTNLNLFSFSEVGGRARTAKFKSSEHDGMSSHSHSLFYSSANDDESKRRTTKGSHQ